MTTVNRITIKNRNSSVAAGIDKHLSAPVQVNGVSLTPAQLKAIFTDHTTAIETSVALRKQWTDQRLATTVAGDKARATYSLLRGILVGMYGKSANAVLNDFGMKPPKTRAPATVGEKKTAVERRAATRAARHTMGPAQKKKVNWETPELPTTNTPAPTTPTTATPPVSTREAAAAAAPPATNPPATPTGATPASPPATTPPATTTTTTTPAPPAPANGNGKPAVPVVTTDH